MAMDLGEPARQTIKGHDLNDYLSRLQLIREKTLAEFRKRDNGWPLAADNTWGWGPTNNPCKWCHVCEHEPHHAGQIAMLKSRAGCQVDSSIGISADCQDFRAVPTPN